MTVIYFDTETNGIGTLHPVKQRIVELGWIYGNKKQKYLIKDVKEINKKDVPHNIRVEDCQEKGENFEYVYEKFFEDLKNAEEIVGHNIEFDLHVIKNELKERKYKNKGREFNNYIAKNIGKCVCTMKESVTICKLPSKFKNYYKYPNLSELYKHFYESEPPLETHDSLNDCIITKMCYEKMKLVLK